MAVPTQNSHAKTFDPSARIDLFTGDPGLNRMVEQINIIRRRLDVLDASRGGLIVPRANRFKIIGMANDYLTCRQYDGETVSTEDIIVAKGPYLRHTLLFAAGGKRYVGVDSIATVNTQTLTASRAGEDDETWRVVPAYAVDQEIYATFAPRGGTGLVVDDVPVEWLEIEHGRAWAQEEPE